MNVIPRKEDIKDVSVTSGPLPASRKIYVPGKVHASVRVPMREISLEPSAKEPPVVVYDTSGPYTDPNANIDIRKGLAPLRMEWIKARGDVEEIAGREQRPEDDGLKAGEIGKVPVFDRAGRKPLRAKAGVSSGLIVISWVALIAHCPLFGVNVYVVVPAVLVLMLAGLQLPLTLFVEVAGSDGAALFWHRGPIVAKVGVTWLVIVISIVVVDAQ